MQQRSVLKLVAILLVGVLAGVFLYMNFLSQKESVAVPFSQESFIQGLQDSKVPVETGKNEFVQQMSSGHSLEESRAIEISRQEFINSYKSKK